MSRLPTLPPEARRILELAREDRAAGREALAKLEPTAQVALVCEAPVSARGALLALSDCPEQVVPALPPAELCYTAKAVGLHDAGWLIEHATDEQLTTCVDLDAWSGGLPDPARLNAWLLAFVDAGEEALLRATRAMDFECLVLMLRERLSAVLKPNDDDWTPPAGGQTLDGQFYFVAEDAKDDLADVVGLLRTLFQRDYWVYFRLLQAVTWELETETQEWARRWRNGRLMDLGFPDPETARALYARMSPEERSALPPEGAAVGIGEWSLPIWMPRFPMGADAERSIFRAMAELDEDERRPILLAFLALANRVAVADDLALGDAETMPAAIDRAAELASRGIDHLARENGVSVATVLRRAPLERLFRVGFHLAREAGDEPAPRLEEPD